MEIQSEVRGGDRGVVTLGSSFENALEVRHVKHAYKVIDMCQGSLTGCRSGL